MVFLLVKLFGSLFVVVFATAIIEIYFEKKANDSPKNMVHTLISHSYACGFVVGCFFVSLVVAALGVR